MGKNAYTARPKSGDNTLVAPLNLLAEMPLRVPENLPEIRDVRHSR